jgi:peptidoglycan L-alanyl-D-glutamate endopeptidase CwlK
MDRTSKRRLKECHEDIQQIIEYVEKEYFPGLKVITGQRTKDEQERLFQMGRSKVRYPNSKHNSNPSRAIDVAFVPIDWENRDQWHYLGATIVAVAKEKFGVELRWGGDWDQDHEVADNVFDDLLHFELV